MGGFAAAIGGVGQGAQNLGTQLRSQQFAHQENALKQTQEQYNNLADALERTKASYSAAPDIVNRLNDVEMQIRAAHMPGQPVDPQSYQKLLQTYLKAKQEANQAWALHPNNPANRTMATPAVQSAVAQATGAPEPIKPVGAAATPTPPPFAPMMVPQQGPPAAQPATSPVQPAAQGGGSSSPATFPTAPVQPVAASGADAGPTSNINTDASIPPISVQAGGASVAPVVDLDKLLARSQAGYEDTGIMSPQLHEALQHQMGTQAALEQLYRSGGVNLELGKKKLEAIQPILSDLHDHPENMMQDLMSIETLTGGGGGAAMALGPLLSAMTPQSEPGMTTAGSLEATHPGFLASQGLTGLHPNTPIRVQVNKFTRQPVSAQVSSVAEQLKPFGEGVFAFNPREGTLTPQQGVTPISMLPSTQTSPGSAPVTTQKGKPATAGAGGGVPPVGGAGGGASAKPASGQFNSTLDQTARDVVQGVQSMPSDSRTANAVRDSARRQGLTIPPVYPPAVQDALAKNMTSLDQINQVMSILRPYKDETKVFTSLPASIEYRLGYTDPKQQLGEMIGKISVTDILAAGRVLGSAGIRSNRFNYNDALTHTPDPRKDSGATMYGKLNWMKQLIEDQNSNSLKYQRKSGVIPTGGGGVSTGGKPPTTAQEYLDSVGH